MRIFISVDMEGISGVEKIEEVFRGGPAYGTFRQIMAGDVNAAVQGAVEGGASDIVVADSHGYMCNMRPLDMHNRATLRSGMQRQLCQFKGFSHRFQGAFFIGYHSKAGTPDGILSHTWIPALRDVRVNGLSVGEYGLNGYLVGSFGVPPVLLCGDDKTVEQARPVLGNIEYVVVKRSLGFFEGEHLPLKESHSLIRAAAKRAVERLRRGTPALPKAELPVTFEVDLARETNSLVTRMMDENRRFLDDDRRTPLSDMELISEYEDVEVRGSETVSFTTVRYVDAYDKLFRILMYFYERDIEWLIDEVSEPEKYQRDLSDLVGREPLNYVGAQ